MIIELKPTHNMLYLAIAGSLLVCRFLLRITFCIGGH